MIRCVLVLAVLLPNLALAQDFKGYRTTTLDAIIGEWNGRTKSDGPGVSFSRPEKIKFIVAKRGGPIPCSNAALKIVLMMINFEDLLNQTSITHCISLERTNGRPVVAYVQDVIVPGLNSDVSAGQSMDIYADVLAYQVWADRSQNAPIMLVNRFEPR